MSFAAAILNAMEAEKRKEEQQQQQQVTEQETEEEEDLTEEQLNELNNLSINHDDDPFGQRVFTSSTGDDQKTLAITNEKITATHLVVDTNAIISGVRLETLGKELWTIPEVLEEVIDSRSKEFLDHFPFEIKTRQPSPQSVAAVTEFSRLTGDYPSLSVVDIKIIALTYTLEAEKNGIDNIKTKPAPTPVYNNNKKKEFTPKEKKVEEKPTATTTTTTTTTTTDTTTTTEASTATPTDKPQKKKRRQKKKPANKAATTTTTTTTGSVEKDTCCDEEEKDEEEENTVNNNNTNTISKKKEKKNALKVDLSKLEESEPQVDPKEVLRQLKEKQREEAEERKKNRVYQEGDEGEWITPDNLAQTVSLQRCIDETIHYDVGCITKDFSMQNVILQMNLNLLSVDGLVIKQVKQFVLKCVACLNFTLNMDKIFCEHCGGKTLYKAMTFVDKHGNHRVSQGSGKQFNLRGTIYSIPKVKGGKKHNDIILTEDQYLHRLRVTGQLYKKKASKEVNLDDLEMGFGNKTIPDDIVIGYGNRNPNIARKSIGKKNKSISIF
ncbi:hypothetical protein CYY_000279 [Polysphondylium violaceum]|uniref:Uncharacterized protein n=1 Tax=Polysphondylium violaceum TaxID=133409 RepID=A0A8J4Q432_9MYCE|nr:hypothetical protein CYY_000279 [Polysphondylium violaceum]